MSSSAACADGLYQQVTACGLAVKSVASWLVAHASSYGITKVSYAGYQWKAQLTETSWQSSSAAGAGGIVAS